VLIGSRDSRTRTSNHNLPKTVSKDTLNKIKEELISFPGNLPVILRIPQNGGSKEIKTKTKVRPDQELLKNLEIILPTSKIALD